MFNKIQNRLLLNHPLLWNTRIVTALIIATVINIIFFIGGYIYGAIDFTEYKSADYYVDETIAFVTFFSVILSLLLFIIWLVYYLRNNAYKYFYPKQKASLYKEWLLIFVICLINCLYTVSFLYGKEVRLKGYYTEAEALKRLDVISKASMFADNTWHFEADTIINEKNIHREYFTYKGKKYLFRSLVNMETYSFSLQDHEQDSVNRVTVQQWLVANKKDSVNHVMQQLLQIAKEHNLKANLTPQQWLDNVYNYPDFNKYLVIGANDYAPVHGYDYRYERNSDLNEDLSEYDLTLKYDAESNIVRIVDGKKEIDPKYYIPLDQLEYAYSKISEGWTNPPLQPEILIVVLYLSIGLSLIIFSFRVTSGRDWLIALVSFGVTAIITGVVSALITNVFFRNVMLIDDEFFFLTIWVVIVLLLLCYFIYIAKKNASKGISAIIINHLLWLLPAVIPVIAAIVFDISKEFNEQIPVDEGYVTIYNPVYLFLENYIMLIVALNILLVFAYMYFFTVSIKKWKGIAEA
ncbi:hypothetical protein FMM05_14520 [Flavobacterium zepuense]|uniref:Uncharacterized protein n=1 Tax=Flavobacterium zepuense TaxID=2593302 RepID=A0A552UYS6_9FLAO|nr:hypothetical protein [Flavobacterium zepuense]TRW23403.1 hypothetical protein FMM05_14520 [Flavobacterium zepuense]